MVLNLSLRISYPSMFISSYDISMLCQNFSVISYIHLKQYNSVMFILWYSCILPPKSQPFDLNGLSSFSTPIGMPHELRKKWVQPPRQAPPSVDSSPKRNFSPLCTQTAASQQVSLLQVYNRNCY